MLTSLVSCSAVEPIIGPKAEKKHTQRDNPSTANTSPAPTNGSATLDPVPDISLDELISLIGASGFVADRTKNNTQQEITTYVNQQTAFVWKTDQQKASSDYSVHIAPGEGANPFTPNNSNFPYTYQCDGLNELGGRPLFLGFMVASQGLQ
jgi:hypothetical protein